MPTRAYKEGLARRKAASKAADQEIIDVAYELVGDGDADADARTIALLPADDLPPTTQAQRERLSAMRAQPDAGSAPWERQPGESQVAYEAFQIYRTQDPKVRSINLVARETGTSAKTQGKRSARWSWVARARQYDAWIVTQKDEAQRRAIAEEGIRIREQQNVVLNQQLAAGRALMRECLRAIQTERAKPNPDARNLSLIGQALDRAVAAQRLATGMPTELTRQDVHLRQELEKAMQIQATVMQIIEEILCDECRARVGDELERVQADRRKVADRAGVL
jgi:hypothetical protein